MSEAAATPEPERPRTLEEWVAVQCDLLARNLAATEDVKRIIRGPLAERDLVELVMILRRLADIEGVMLDVGEHIRDAATVRTLEQMHRARQAVLSPVPEPEPAPRRRRGGHRKGNPDQRPLYPRSLKGLVPLGAVAALRHSPAAAHTAAALTAVGGTAATFALGAALVTGSPAHSAPAYPGPGSTPAGINWSATPVTSPSDVARAATHPKLDARSWSRNPAVSSGPQPSGAPASGPPPQQPPAAQVQVAGTLQVDATGLDLGVAYAGTVTVTAVGGPVSWGAVRGSGDITLGASQGVLQAGESATIGVAVTAAAQILGGSATVRIWPGNITVAVTWAALPVPVDVPSVSPSVLPTLPGI